MPPPITIKGFTCCLSLAIALQGSLEIGFVRLNLSVIERRFGLSASQTAIVLTGYEAVFTVLLVPFTYLTGKPGSDRPWMIMIGLLIIGLGSITLSLPEFLYPPKPFSPENITDLCYSDRGTKLLLTERDQPEKSLLSAKTVIVGVLVLGNCLVGVGSMPLYTLAIPWIDENLPKRVSAIYVGLFYSANILGPAVGYVIGGLILDNIHTDFLVHPTILSSSSRIWVGAWWTLFLGIGLITLAFGSFLLIYPKNLVRSEADEMYNIQEGPGERGTVLQALKNLSQNSMYVSLCAVSILEAFILGFNNFISKYIQNQFGLSTKGASIIMGCLLVPAGFLGIITGGYIVKRYRLSSFRLLLLILSSLVISLACSAGLIIVNDPVKFAGINTPYQRDSSEMLDTKVPNEPDLLSPCNKHCLCDERYYDPICGVDLITYYNPCFAGCHARGRDIQGTIVYFDCSCISIGNKSNQRLIENDRRSFNLDRYFLSSHATNLKSGKSRRDITGKDEDKHKRTELNLKHETENQIDEKIENFDKSFSTNKNHINVRRNRRKNEHAVKIQPKAADILLMMSAPVKAPMNKTSIASHCDNVSLINHNSKQKITSQSPLQHGITTVSPFLVTTRSIVPHITTCVSSSSTTELILYSSQRSSSASKKTTSLSRSSTDVILYSPPTSKKSIDPNFSTFLTAEISNTSELSADPLYAEPCTALQDSLNVETSRFCSRNTLTNYEESALQDPLATPSDPTQEKPAFRSSPERLTYREESYALHNLSGRSSDAQLAETSTIASPEILAYGKACPNTSTHIALFSVSTFLAFFFMFLSVIPATEGILRSVPFEYKSLSMAVQWLFIRLLGMLPSSNILALFVDSSCLYWLSGKDCILYDNYYFSRYLATFAFFFRHLSIYILLYMVFKVKIEQVE